MHWAYRGKRDRLVNFSFLEEEMGMSGMGELESLRGNQAVLLRAVL